jgi:hypothetical protein
MDWHPQDVAALFGFGISGFALFAAWHSFRRVQALADTPIARIRSAPQGYVELCGRAALMPGPPILGPLSSLPCVWYRYRLEERTSGNKWRVVSRGVSDSLFLIEDNTGQCVVDPDGAEFTKTTRDVWYGTAGGVRTFALLGIGAHYRYLEQRIMPGEEVHAIGLFKTVGGNREPPDTRREVARLLERWKKNPRMMALFDRRRNGRIDPDEWEAARLAAHRQVQRQQLERATEPDIHTLSDTGDSNRPYLIAALSEGRLIRKYQLDTGLYLGLALAAGSYLAWLFQ